MGRQGVIWQFIPKHGPWFGGFWEYLIGLTKAAIKKVLGRAFVSLSTLQTIIVEVEAHLNNRPLNYVSSELDDPDPLIPTHLLYGRYIVTQPHLPVEDELNDPDYKEKSTQTEMTRRAKVQAKLLQHFWVRWKIDYLTSLREFHVTTGNNQQRIRIGEAVLVHDDVLPRNKWRLAVIERLVTDNDGLIRTVHIRTSTGRKNRPITKLYPLEVTAHETPGCDSTKMENDTTSDCAGSKEKPNISTRSRRGAAVWACQAVAQLAD